METIFAIICLLSLPVVLGFKHIIEYQENAFIQSNFGIGSLLALLIYVMYFGLLLFQGIEGLYAHKEFGRQSYNFSEFFIAPSLGFWFAIFPKAASEYFSNFSRIHSIEFKSQYCTLVGWLLIVTIISIVAF